jgi:BRCA1-associated protein
VWDYAGDAYVHRLIQNRTDGKLVELPSASITAGTSVDSSRALGPGPADAMAAEKVEAIGIEYSYLLTSQLDSQRAYYEEQMQVMKDQITSVYAKLEMQAHEIDALTSQRQVNEQKWAQETSAQLVEVNKERTKLEKKAEKTSELAKKFEKELKEEKMVNDGLLQNLAVSKKKSDAFEQEKGEFMKRIQELEDQMRDLMFYLETRDKVQEEGSELAGASVELRPASTPTPTTSTTKKKKKR